MEDTLVKEKEQTCDLDGGAEVHSTARTGSAIGNRARLYRWINIEYVLDKQGWTTACSSAVEVLLSAIVVLFLVIVVLFLVIVALFLVIVVLLLATLKLGLSALHVGGCQALARQMRVITQYYECYPLTYNREPCKWNRRNLANTGITSAETLLLLCTKQKK